MCHNLIIKMFSYRRTIMWWKVIQCHSSRRTECLTFARSVRPGLRCLKLEKRFFWFFVIYTGGNFFFQYVVKNVLIFCFN